MHRHKFFTVLANKWEDHLYWNGVKLFCTNGRSYINTRAFWKVYRISEDKVVIHDLIKTKFFPR